MARTTTMTVRLSGPLSEHVSANVGEGGYYENVSEYIRERPSSVLGPVDTPPWSLHRPLPAIAAFWQEEPRRVFARHL